VFKVGRTTHRAWFVASLVVALSALAGCGSGSSGNSGDGHAVNASVTFDDVAGRTVVNVNTAGTARKSPKSFRIIPGDEDLVASQKGIFVVVNLHFESALPSDTVLELMGGDKKLYGWTYTNEPGARPAPDKSDPHRFTIIFDVPPEAAHGALLLVHEHSSEIDPLASIEQIGQTAEGRDVPAGYLTQAVHEIKLGT
jgi:hypothetical protein